MSKGFLVFAQNSDSVDYIQQAYALALSIKYSQNTVKNISLVTNDVVPEKYSKVFDQIIPIPWFDSAGESPLQAEHRWKLYYTTPYNETIVLDADMFVLGDISLWWDYCSNFDIKFCNKIRNYKLEPILQDTYHRKTFIANNLPNPYFALHYFKKNQPSFEFYKILEFVVKNWEFCRGTFAPLEPQEWISMDLAASIALVISGMQDDAIDILNPLEFIHMKPAIQGWNSTPISWRNYVNSVLNSKGEFVVGNIKQEKIFHYVEKSFINEKIINRLEELAYGS